MRNLHYHYMQFLGGRSFSSGNFAKIQGWGRWRRRWGD